MFLTLMEHYIYYGRAQYNHVRKMKQAQVENFQQKLLAWYDRHARELPWRVRKGKQNPYFVWMSEVMLQQTTVATVKDYFLKFITKWPTVDDLANASEDAVLAEWSGLGYYNRARNLHKCAKTVVNEYDGKFPSSYELLKTLPGIGDYTASAISAIAFDKQAVVVDGNVERVISRYFYIEEPLPLSKPLIKQKAALLADMKSRHGDYAQAMMDLGATICTPKSPKCLLCPVHEECKAYKKGGVELLPRKLPKKTNPVKYTTAFFLYDDKGRFFLRKRDESGMLANMFEVVTEEWVEDKKIITKQIPYDKLQKLNWQKTEGQIKHIFTHFDFYIDVQLAKVPKKLYNYLEGEWVMLEELPNYGVPTVMKKVIYHALKNLA